MPNLENAVVKDDVDLLRLMMADADRQEPLHRPGPYWSAKGRVIAHEIERDGLRHFRDGSSLVGLSFADAPMIDYRLSLNHGPRTLLGTLLRRLWPVSAIFDAQVAWTRSHAAMVTELTAAYLRVSPRVQELLARYSMPESRLGGAVRTVDIGGRSISMHYLSMLDELDHVASVMDLSRVTSMAEVGGGFGANVHLLLTNFPNLRKVLYVDVPPVLYVGTQYLRAIFGSAISDYRATRDAGTLRFRDDDTLEIMCIAPWQLERFEGSVGLLWNAHSFVEIPRESVEFYARFFSALPARDPLGLALLTYDFADADRTLPASSLPDFFPGRDFVQRRGPRLLEPDRSHLYFVSEGGRPDHGRISAAR